MVPEDNPKFQGLLKDYEEAAPYPDISAELPGVELDEEEREFQTVSNKPEPDFCDLAAAALHNAGINANDRVRAAQAVALANAERGGAALIEADDDKIVYKITFDLPNAGLPPPPTLHYRYHWEMTEMTGPLRPSFTTTKRKFNVIRYKV